MSGFEITEAGDMKSIKFTVPGLSLIHICGKLTAYTGTDNKHTGAYRTVFKVAIPIRYNVA